MKTVAIVKGIGTSSRYSLPYREYVKELVRGLALTDNV